MRFADLLLIFSYTINVLIFLYFSIILIKLNVLDIVGLSISAFGIFISLITNIISIVSS